MYINAINNFKLLPNYDNYNVSKQRNITPLSTDKFIKNTSFTASKNAKHTVELLKSEVSAKQYSNIVKVYAPKLPLFTVFKDFSIKDINENNCFIIKNIIDNYELLENEKFVKVLPDILTKDNSYQEQNSVALMINKITNIKRNNPVIYNNKNFNDNVGDIIEACTWLDDSEPMISMINTIDKFRKTNSDLWNIENFRNNIGNIIYSTRCNEEAAAFNEAFKYTKLWENEKFADTISCAVYAIGNEYDAKILIEIIRTFAKICENDPDTWNKSASMITGLLT